jgi:hypothetical protein
VRSRAVVVALLAVGAAALLLRRRSVSRGDHVDVYFEDGSMVSLEAGAPRAEELLAVARKALARVQA